MIDEFLGDIDTTIIFAKAGAMTEEQQEQSSSERMEELLVNTTR